MARPLRLEYAGAIYHVMNRGDRRQAIFRSKQDRILFLETLGAACMKAGWQVHAYCLLTDHFHLVVETPRSNLVSGMKWFLGTYTMRFNKRHRSSGHLFGGRYKAQVIDESEPRYLRMAADCVHLNPARAGLVAGNKALESYGWSSYPLYLAAAGRRPGWLRVDRLLGAHGIVSDAVRGRREFSRRMEVERSIKQSGRFAELRSGWLVGAEDFASRLVERVEGKVKKRHRMRECSETEVEKAQRIIARELAATAWDEKRLRAEAKGHPLKIRIARILREQTTMHLKWIADALATGSWTYLNHLLHRRSS